MSIYKNFCTETFDRDGVLTGFSVHCPENFNFGYDVVDRLADMTPGKTALVWCNTENEEHIFTFDDIQTYSNKMANVFRAAGIGRGDRVMVILKRHYEYWFAAIALHKLGAVMIPATHMLTVSDLVYRIEASRVKGIICTCQDHVPEKLRQALHRAGSGGMPGDGSGVAPGDGSGGMPAMGQVSRQAMGQATYQAMGQAACRAMGQVACQAALLTLRRAFSMFRTGRPSCGVFRRKPRTLST